MEKIQDYWVDPFLALIELCKIKPNESIIVLTETRSRELNVIILEQAIKKIGLEFADLSVNKYQKNKIILVYPIPEVGWNVPRKVFYERYDNNNITSSDITFTISS